MDIMRYWREHTRDGGKNEIPTVAEAETCRQNIRPLFFSDNASYITFYYRAVFRHIILGVGGALCEYVTVKSEIPTVAEAETCRQNTRPLFFSDNASYITF